MITYIRKCGMKLLIHSQTAKSHITEIWGRINDFILHFSWACDYLSTLGIKLIRVSKYDSVAHVSGMDSIVWWPYMICSK